MTFKGQKNVFLKKKWLQNICVKDRLIKAMDSQRNKNRPKLLLDIVKAINSTENKAVRGLKPSEIETSFDNFKLEEKMEDRKYQQPHWYK